MAMRIESIEELDEAQFPVGQLIGMGSPQLVQDTSDEFYFAPTDPVLIGQDIVCGFSHVDG